ncbi:MAG: bifunctional glutamate N-acetyltransferase/amino-acid acetyltransferase ArgJ [Armatimonadota bacterium]|nr:bifunctional glutamate N-acetyltransferase/amino-acid acetyltransferase ArgJ [Armatimonadota bacterium]
MATPAGFVAGAARGGIKMQGDDVALILSKRPATVAAVFTRNLVKAAPVLICARHAANPTARAIIANAGNANCCTGEQGLAAAIAMCQLAAVRIGCDPHEVLVCSTGIIGHPLPMEQVEAAIGAIELGRVEATNEAVARAVMTTDTRPKFCAARARINGHFVTIGGLAKGAGMIGPDMGPFTPPATLHATLLSFLTTDAAVPKALLQQALQETVERTFNSVTVDGDTSTNDTCLLLANGASGVQINDTNYAQFTALLNSVCVHLAKMVAADGEGATKLVTVEVTGAATTADARHIAMTVANSPLVKTAIFGGDPNWGRIAAAAGRAGVALDPAELSVALNEIEVFSGGEPTRFDLAEAEAAMQGDELTVHVALAEGEAMWTAWTCDFSYDYVKINAEYHT